MATIPNEMRFLGVNSSLIDLVEKKDSTNNEKTEYYSLDDIRGYKVFTALLTQSGGDGATNFGNDSIQPFIIGATYMIAQNDSFGDFTNIGAANNDVGTYFVATGTTPASWGDIGSGDVNVNYNTGAPVATVLENTIGDIWFSYENIGLYTAQSVSLFTNNKTAIYFGALDNNPGSPTISTDHFANNSQIYSFNTLDQDASAQNEMLYNTPIEIRVYN
jgi:hypothetical protein